MKHPTSAGSPRTNCGAMAAVLSCTTDKPGCSPSNFRSSPSKYAMTSCFCS
ncbi:hypothetical protein ACL00T_06370 [Curtobacterium flaccumfaciens]